MNVWCGVDPKVSPSSFFCSSKLSLRTVESEEHDSKVSTEHVFDMAISIPMDTPSRICGD